MPGAVYSESRVAPYDLLQRFSRVARFAVVSGLGLALDFCLSVALRELGVPAFFANLTGAACAVTFVFFASVRSVFQAQPTPAQRARKYAAYMVWQALAVPVASLAIAWLTPWGTEVARWLASYGGDAAQRLGDRPGAGFLVAKCACTPVTFYANFLFMGWLLTGKVRWR